MSKSIRNLLESLDKDSVNSKTKSPIKPVFENRTPKNPIPGDLEEKNFEFNENIDASIIDDEIKTTRIISPPIPYISNGNQVNHDPILNEDQISNTSSIQVNKFLDNLIKKNRNRIVVVGVGGGGCNAINRLSKNGECDEVMSVAANTDAIHLREVNSNEKLLLGLELTEGLGAGNDPVIGKAAAEESIETIETIVQDSDMVFVTTGMGGGTGTGAAPIIADIARKSGSLVVGICTLPFEMEGDTRARHAIQGLKEFYSSCDTVIVIPNEKLMELAPDLPIGLAFKVSDEILVRAVKGIVNLIITPAYVNVDFADIRQILKQGGSSVIGMGEGEGENRIEDALRESLSNSLLDIHVMDCKAALINIAGGPSLSLDEVRSCVHTISQEMGEDSEIIWGTHINPELGERIQVTAILSGVSSPYNLNFGLAENQESSLTVHRETNIRSIWD